MPAIVVVSTFPSEDKAAEVARTLVDERLAACVNLVPNVRSIYRWQDAVSDDREVLAIIKTENDRDEQLCKRLVALHPYEVPEVVVVSVAGGHSKYLEWITAMTR